LKVEEEFIYLSTGSGGAVGPVLPPAPVERGAPSENKNKKPPLLSMKTKNKIMKTIPSPMAPKSRIFIF